MASASRKRIFSIEDDKDSPDMGHSLLGEYGYEAVIGASGSDALESGTPGGLALAYLIIG